MPLEIFQLAFLCLLGAPWHLKWGPGGEWRSLQEVLQTLLGDGGASGGRSGDRDIFLTKGTKARF